MSSRARLAPAFDMPEGHSVHRIAQQFDVNFVGTRPRVSSPQGRFALGAAILDGRQLLRAQAVGKQLFLEFAGDQWLRVHLGIYGAWDFAGLVRVAPSIQVHTQHATKQSQRHVGAPERPIDREAEDSVASIGAPRRTRLRPVSDQQPAHTPSLFPPEPRGQVRVRLLTEAVCADLRGPTACEVLTPDQVAAVLQRLGPDPANENTAAERQRFVSRAAKKATPIGLVLMDQSVIAGIGNVYRAELLFRAKLDPHTPARSLDHATLHDLWHDWAALLATGIAVGQMITIDGLEGDSYRQALVNREDRHWVYRRDGLQCKRCGAMIVLELMGSRKLYWCPGCQHSPASVAHAGARQT